MATDLEQKPATTSPKHENFVVEQLARVEGRIRTLDAGGFFLLFLLITLGYAFVMALVDPVLTLPTAVRLVGFLIYLGAAGYCLARAVLCFTWRVNPYYAAKQLEQSLPEAKNS